MIGAALYDRLDQRGDVTRVMRTVTVDEDQDVAGRLADCQADRAALARAIVQDDARTVFRGDLAVPSVLWPSTTSNSSANGAASSSTGRTFSASLRTGRTTVIRCATPSGPVRLISVGRLSLGYQMGNLTSKMTPCLT